MTLLKSHKENKSVLRMEKMTPAGHDARRVFECAKKCEAYAESLK